MFKLLKKYTEIPGPIGYEQRVHEQFKSDLEKFSDEVKYTNVGNLLAHFPGKGKKVILVGHADEICYYVQSITEEGFLCINSAKSRHDYVDYPYSLVGQKALVIGDYNDVRGVFIAPSGHVLRDNEKKIPLEVKNVFVDLGLSSSKEVQDLGIHIGCPIIWNPVTEKLNDNAFGKAMDDRLSHAIMLKLAEKLIDEKLNFDLSMASTVQEEVFLLGAHALNRGDYDISLAIDIGIAGDYPPLEKNRMPIKLSKGPVLVYKDSQAHYNVEIIKELRRMAEKNNVPFQHGIFYNYGSDSGAMIKGGIKPNLIAPPCRYTHSPYETVNLKDLENTVNLLYYYLTQ